MPYDGYRITIEKLTPNGHTMRQTEIVCTSDYTLADDLAEWVKTEIDADASVVKTEFEPTDTPITRVRMIDTEKCPVNKSHHIPVTEMGVTTCEECAYVLTSVWHAP